MKPEAVFNSNQNHMSIQKCTKISYKKTYKISPTSSFHLWPPYHVGRDLPFACPSQICEYKYSPAFGPYLLLQVSNSTPH